ncbi:hypothetical protein KO498_13845, partial [Lentibacter algarum]|uniref:pentapeptide repeat-containing protein n=1 Tax=Lentibacter algarum TaxID=576131 RepID=UPI0020907A34
MSDNNITIGLTLPANIAITLGLALAIVIGSALIYFALPSGKPANTKHNRGAQDFLKILAILLAPVWLFLFAHILWALWQLAVTFSPTEKGSDLRWHILAFVGLITALGGLLSAPLALVRVWTTERQTRTAEQGHITERITKAVEQLGAEKTVKKLNDDGQTVETSEPNIEVRIGGLLSLERIAQDSTADDKGRDHVRVMEIVCAYVRENSNATPPQDFPEPDWKPLKDDPTEKQRKAHIAEREARLGNFVTESIAFKWAQTLPKPRADIQQALDILGRRGSAQRQVEARWGKDAALNATWVFDTPCPHLPEEPTEAPLSPDILRAYKSKLDAWKQSIDAYQGYRLDLRGANLQGADMSTGIYAGARLEAARLEGADLFGARLEGAYL